MSLPEPQPGLVVRYSYLWLREHEAGAEEGRKDRPCAMILVLGKSENGRYDVAVLPITHAPPKDRQTAVELPAVTKARLGLDGAKSWIVLDEANRFTWPGPDLRPVPGKPLESAVVGMLPPGILTIVRDRFLALAASGRATLVPRTE